MDNSDFAGLVIATFIFITAWRYRNIFYAMYVQGGVFRMLFYPFVFYRQYRKIKAWATDEWAREVIDEHKKSTKTDTNS